MKTSISDEKKEHSALVAASVIDDRICLVGFSCLWKNALKLCTRFSLLMLLFLGTMLILTGGAFAASPSVDCPLISSGCVIYTPESYVKDARTLFGFEDNPIFDSWVRSYAWINLSPIPSGVAIVDASIGLGWDVENNPNNNMSRNFIRIIGQKPTNWDSSTAKQQWDRLATGSTLVNELAYGLANKTFLFNLRYAGKIDWVAGADTFGIAFKIDEALTNDIPFWDDSTLYSSRVSGNTMTVSYCRKPILHSPVHQSHVPMGTVTLRWNAQDQLISPLKYRVQWSTVSNFSIVQGQTLTSSTTWDQTFAQNAKIYWRVRVEDPDNNDNHSDWSGPIYFITDPLVLIPSPPTGVSASDGTYTDKVRVSWTASSGATSYEIWRNTSSSSSGASKIGDDSSSPYYDYSAVAGTTYWYWVKAKNSAGTSGFSSSNSGYRAVSIPSPPTGVSASDGTYTDKVRVSWNHSSGATSYEIWRGTGDLSSSASKIADDSSSPYNDYSAVAGKMYKYWLKAKNSAGTSGFSSGDVGYRGFSVPQPPTSVSASDGTYNDKIRVSWTASSGATDYEIWRNTSNSSSSASKIADDSSSPYEDTLVQATITYYYWVKAKNSAGTSGFSNGDSGYRASVNTLPVPTNVSASDGTYTDKVVIGWTPSSGATYYEIWRSHNSSMYKIDETTASGYDDHSAVVGTIYTYWIKARNSAGESSGFSDGDSGYRATVTVPLPPTGVSASDGTYTDKVRVSWTASSGATSYEIWRGTSQNGSYYQMATTSKNDTDYDDNCGCGKTYWYKVKAYNTGGESGYSNSDRGNSQSCSGNDPILSVTPASRSVDSGSGTTTFAVDNTGGGTMSWTALVISGGSWLSITSGDSGTNNGTITAAFSANTSGSPRTGTIRVTASGASGSPKDVTVVQAGGGTQYTITASAGSNGSISPSGDIVKNEGEDQQFTATPSTNYAVDKWYLDGSPVKTGGSTYTLQNIQSGHTVYVTFKYVPLPEIRTISITKCRVKAGKSTGQDSIRVSGRIDVTADEFDNADTIYVDIWSDADDYLVYSESIDRRLFSGKKGRYSHRYRVKKGQPGAITTFKIDTNKRKFQLQAKNIDLTGLGCPLSVEIEIGDYYGVGQADEDIVNGKKPIPMQLMRGYADTLRVDKVKVKSGKKPSSDSLSVKGTIVVDDNSKPTDGVVVSWGSQSFAIPGSSFTSGGARYQCRNVNVSGGSVSITIDLDKCSFMVGINKADIDSDSGDFGIAFGNFDKTVAEADLP